MDIHTPALIVLVGPSSAGKSTWAKKNFEPNEVVSSDTLRGVVGAGEDDQTASTAAFEILDRIVEERLRRGMTTVVDTLGFEETSRERWSNWANEAGMPTRYIVFNTSSEICEQRNNVRSRSIPKTVLRKQLSRFKDVVATLDPSLTTNVVADAEEADMGEAQQPTQSKRPSAGHEGHSFGLLLSRFNWEGGDLGSEMSNIALRAEAAGFRDVWVMDHFRQIPQVGRAWEDIPEAYTALSFVAGVTTTVRLGALVTGVTHRHPVVLGKMIASLDVLSGGRAVCGLGIAWDQAEHKAYGVEFPTTKDRYELLEETLQMLPLLWGKGTPSYEGNHIVAKELVCYPRPIQDRIPVLIGGSGEKKTLRLVAQYGDAANVFGDPERVRHKVSVLREHCADVDRNPDEIEVTHLTNAFSARDRGELIGRANELRDRNQTAENFIKSNGGGTVEQLVERFTEYDESGATHTIVALPDVAHVGSIETFGDVIEMMSQS